ncbi:Bax inhibitor-1/YccA family protein [Parasulfuritortus cantonensis]|uniref:Bax inhibitor-1/YccA family protein n=1 Tax=Parasulfuritortus cantonensis TaxID=2528202 RepID=A0A4R1B6C2_9PROT|nr:Bax inhibitor-1/YccA family protein [Parasulfuritortus cantonensis]TCJ11768.1 Bax inhibitor-1/YccA family protein [Parasulfuritortus cantonensis]
MQPQYDMTGYDGSVSLGTSRNKVLRNTYMLLGISLVPTVVGALVGMSMNFAFMAGHPILYTVGMFAVMMGLFFAISATRNSGLGVVLLLVLTGFMGLMLGPILQVALHLSNGAQIVGLAAGGTAAIFMVLAGIASTSKRDFSFMGKFLLVGIVLLILASVANLFFHIPALALTLSAVAVLLFSGFILFDVSRVVNGGETNYVMATLAIYLDIYNLFVNLLQLLMALMGERD